MNRVVVALGGIAAAAVVVLAVAGSRAPSQAAAPVSPPSPQGRYQIVYSPHAARDTFLLDTQTGRVWEVARFTYLNGDPAIWDLMDRIDSESDRAAVNAKYGPKPPATKQ